MIVWVAADGNVPCSLNEHGEYCLDPEDRTAALLLVRRCDAERFLAELRAVDIGKQK